MTADSQRELEAEKGQAQPPADAAAHGRTRTTPFPLFARTRRFLSSPVAWAAGIIAACIAIAQFDAAPLAWVATACIFIAIAGWHDAIRGQRGLRRRLAAVESQAHGSAPQHASTAGTIGHSTIERANAAVQEVTAIASDALPGKSPDLPWADAADPKPDPAAAVTSHGLTFLRHSEDQDREPGAPQRRTRRLPQELLQSSFGRVLDLSRGGVRIRIEGKRMPAGIVPLEILAEDGPLRVQAEVVWTKPDKRGGEIGMRFVNLAPDSAQRITAICMQHRCRTTMTESSSV